MCERLSHERKGSPWLSRDFPCVFGVVEPLRGAERHYLKATKSGSTAKQRRDTTEERHKEIVPGAAGSISSGNSAGRLHACLSFDGAAPMARGRRHRSAGFTPDNRPTKVGVE